MASTGSSSSVDEAAAAGAAADVVVAVTSQNDARTVGDVVRALRDGLARYCGSSRVRFVLADAGSTDGTREAAHAAAGELLDEVPHGAPSGFGELPYHGQPGRAAALRAILQTARGADAKACAVVDAGVRTVGPEWVERLIVPVLRGDFDYASPYFARSAQEGAITKGIVYPMFRALYGARLRQPAAGEFSCSARLAAHYLEQDFWDVEQAAAGIDLWLAVEAVSGGFHACEAALGARTATARDAPSDLSTTLAQVVGALFAELEPRSDVWQRIRGSTAMPIVGSPPADAPEAPPLNVEGLIESFKLGYRELREIWTWVLPPRTIVDLRRLTAAPPGSFAFDDRLWATIVYDFALGYTFRVMPREHLLRSLTPLYTGWLASFVLQMERASLAQIEARVEQVCLAFESEKRYLISRWRWPERLRS
jgi:hypothetical protein